MKDHGLIQLHCCIKAKDYCILHGTLLVFEIILISHTFSGVKQVK